MRRPTAITALVLVSILARGAAAAELEDVYPNGDPSLQHTLMRLCDQAVAGDRVTIRLAAGEIREQFSTTIACRKAVSWRFAGAGIGKTVFSDRGVSSKYVNPTTGEEVTTPGRVFSVLLGCGPANPWTKPDGGNICETTFRAPIFPEASRELCRWGAVPEDPSILDDLATTCEFSDLTIKAPVDANGARLGFAGGAIGAGWAVLIVRRVEIQGFPGGNIGCYHCRADVQHARLRCTAGSGIGIALATNDAWPADGPKPSGTDVRHVDTQDCATGVLANRHAHASITDVNIAGGLDGMMLINADDLTVSHNRIVGTSGAGVRIIGTVGSTFSFNHLAGNAVGFVLTPGSGGNTFEHNLDFANEQFGVTDDSTVSIPAIPEGW
jgi:hypothetical protein